MAQTKIYPSTQAQVQAVQDTVDAIDNKLISPDLSNIGVYALDFVNDDVTIISGGLDEYAKRITN